MTDQQPLEVNILHQKYVLLGHCYVKQNDEMAANLTMRMYFEKTIEKDRERRRKRGSRKPTSALSLLTEELN